MIRPYGITFEIGRADGAWFVYVGRLKLLKMRASKDGVDVAGLKLDFCFGPWRRPIPKFWKKEFWSRDYMVQEPATNAWNSGNHWFVIPSFPFIGAFMSASLGEGRSEVYAGTKTYEVNEISQGYGLYHTGDPEVYLHKLSYPKHVAWGRSDEAGNIYLCLSASLRIK